MAVLVTIKGPDVGRQFPLEASATSLGRHAESTVFLESQAVSRQHARIVCDEGAYFIEDLDSSNGTFLNGRRISGRTPLTEQDTLQIGPYVLGLRRSPTVSLSEESLVIREQMNADPSSISLYVQDPASKLQVVLEISRHLARTLDLEELLGKLMDYLMLLFPQADRGMILLKEGERLVVRAQTSRQSDKEGPSPYSRTIVRRVLEEGIGILSEDVGADKRFKSSDTLVSLELRSLLCVPLLAGEGKRLGIMQLDRFRPGGAFSSNDLQLFSTVALQVAVALENASLHAEVLREERFRQELALAREVQESFLPDNFPSPEVSGYELFARVLPAREVSGDFYDFFPIGDGRVSFFIGDVSGKGMPAALFMVAVRILGRHLACGGLNPGAMLNKLNAALAADNPAGMFVTLEHGIYDPKSGEVVIASAGHPLPLLRRNNGRVEEIVMESGRLLGYEGDLAAPDVRIQLAPGESLFFYTDGFPDAHAPGSRVMLGPDRVRETVRALRPGLSLEACADQVRTAVEQFTGTKELQDDLTLLLIRRVSR